MAANLSVQSSYSRSEMEQFYLNVQRGDILHFIFNSCTCTHVKNRGHCKHHFGVFIDKSGLDSHSQMCVVHLEVLPNRVQRGFLMQASTLAKQGIWKWKILSSVAHYQIDKVAVNSIEELFSISKTEKITIDNEMTTFWNDEQDMFPYRSPCPNMGVTFSQYMHTCKKWADVLKMEV